MKITYNLTEDQIRDWADHCGLWLDTSVRGKFIFRDSGGHILVMTETETEAATFIRGYYLGMALKTA